jgi:hypothetical protein
MKYVDTGVKGHRIPVLPEDVEVCRAYEENINSFEDLPHAMVCERLINPKFKDFGKPAWRPLDPWENREKIYDMYLFAFRTISKITDKEWQRAKDIVDFAILNNENYSLFETYIDIDNDGSLDHVYKWEHGYAKCDPTNEYHFRGYEGRKLFVWNDNTNTVNLGRSGYMRTLGFDAFLYKGKTYLDWFGANVGFRDGILFVFRSGVKICQYRYIKEPKKGDGRK